MGPVRRPMTPAEAHTDVLHDRPEGDTPSGLRQEARDPYTRVRDQIIDAFAWPSPLHIWVWAWREQTGLKAEGTRAVALKEETV